MQLTNTPGWNHLPVVISMHHVGLYFCPVVMIISCSVLHFSVALSIPMINKAGKRGASRQVKDDK